MQYWRDWHIKKLCLMFVYFVVHLCTDWFVGVLDKVFAYKKRIAYDQVWSSWGCLVCLTGLTSVGHTNPNFLVCCSRHPRGVAAPHVRWALASVPSALFAHDPPVPLAMPAVALQALSGVLWVHAGSSNYHKQRKAATQSHHVAWHGYWKSFSIFLNDYGVVWLS